MNLRGPVSAGTGRCTARGVWGLAFVAVLLGALLGLVAAAEPRRVVLHELRDADLLVCAEYTSQAAPREPNRSCKSAADVRAWLLREAKDDCQ